MDTTASLARAITWASSKQSYLTARLLADRDLVDDCLRAYAYFRWADDMIDIHLQTSDDQATFIVRQQALIESLYRGERPADLCPQEDMLADLVVHDRRPHSGLQSFIRNFMTVIAFDANRRGQVVGRRELSAYMTCLGTAVMDGLLYFIGNRHSYPRTPDRTQAVIGAHLTHMLRDMREDLLAGFINIPAEDIAFYGISLDHAEEEAFRQWVLRQVEEAKRCFREGQAYIESLDMLRAKLAGVWYCARFECILAAIQRDGYRLRQEYPERRCWQTWARMVWLGIAVTVKHVAGRIRQTLPHLDPRAALASRSNIPTFPLQ